MNRFETLMTQAEAMQLASDKRIILGKNYETPASEIPARKRGLVV